MHGIFLNRNIVCSRWVRVCFQQSRFKCKQNQWKVQKCIFSLTLNLWVWWLRRAHEKLIQKCYVLQEFSASVRRWLSEQSSLTYLRTPSVKARSRSEYSPACFTYYWGLLPFCLPGPFIFVWSQTCLEFFLCWLWLTQVPVWAHPIK